MFRHLRRIGISTAALRTGYLAGFICLCMTLVVLSTVMGSAAVGPDRDVLYQVSTIDALMAGLFDGWVTTGELKRHGDFGLGTFDRLDGEMTVVDGIVYQITSDGLVHKPSDSVTTPFAAVTCFDRDITSAIPHEMTLPTLKDFLDSLLPSKNVFYAIRIDGTFPRIKTRSVPRQSKPYPKLAGVTEHQPEFELTNVKGTIVAFRCPYYVKGVNVPGYHMHFITADRKQGGHLLDCTISGGTAALDTTGKFFLLLPSDRDFYHTNLESVTEGVGKVEQDTP